VQAPAVFAGQREIAEGPQESSRAGIVNVGKTAKGYFPEARSQIAFLIRSYRGFTDNVRER
jgi:hypothetical protein